MLLTNGSISLLFAAPLLWYVWAIATGREAYDGQAMVDMSLLGAGAVAMTSWVPHLIVIDDGGLPKFAHEKNTAFTYWWLVVTLTICATLLALAPILPLADGYHLSDTGITFTRGFRSMPVALWIVAPPAWAVSTLLFYLIGRGLWRRYSHAAHGSGDPTLRTLEALVPPLRGKLILTNEQRQERAQQARERRHKREKQPEGRLNLPGFLTMFLWVSSLLVGLPLPSILMWAWPANVRLPIGLLIVLCITFGWLTLTIRLRAPRSWLALAGLGGLFLVTALLLTIQGVAPPLLTAVVALYGVGHLSVGLFKWFRAEKT